MILVHVEVEKNINNVAEKNKTVKFEFKKINDKYLLTDTTLFDHIGSAN